jgi:hypothetical protein
MRQCRLRRQGCLPKREMTELYVTSVWNGERMYSLEVSVDDIHAMHVP